MSTTSEIVERLREDAGFQVTVERSERLLAAAEKIAELERENARMRAIVAGAASIKMIDAEDVKGEIVFRFTIPGNDLFNPPKFWLDARALAGSGEK
jgi:hypothetical protein